MIDFSFLRNNDIIIIGNKYELEAILAEFEEAGICWVSRRRATTKVWLPDDSTESIRFIRYYKQPSNAGFITYSTSGEPTGYSFAYEASELLQLRYSDSTDSDFEPLNESDLRGYLSV